MKKIILLLFLSIYLLLPFPGTITAQGESGSVYDLQQEVELQLNDRQKLQLEFEYQYLDSVFTIINKYFGDVEGFDKYGEIYIESEPKPHFVIAVTKDNVEADTFIQEISKVVPEDLLVINKVDYSKAYLLKVQDELISKINEGSVSFKDGITTAPSVKEQKVIVRLPKDYTPNNKNYINSLFKDTDLIKFEESVENETTKARDSVFSELGGGIEIKGTCSTTGIATKDTREFLITAGHCISNIGSSVTQGGVSIGTQHTSNFKNGGIDVGLVLLTNTNKKYGNKFYYNDVANTEYDKKYTTTGVALTGQLICKSGKTTNVTCSTVSEQDGSVTYGNITVYSTITVKNTDGSLFCDGGDSGGIVFNAYNTNQLIGIVSGKGTTSTSITYGYIAKIVPALSSVGAVELYTSDTVKTVNQNN